MKDNTMVILCAELGATLLAAVCAFKDEWSYVGMVVVGMMSLAAGHLNGSSTPQETLSVLVKEQEDIKKKIEELQK